MSDEDPKKRRWIIFAVAGSVAVVLGVIFGGRAILEWRWQNRHAATADSSRHAATADSSRVTVSGVVVQSYLGKEGANASPALKFQTTAFGDLDCTFENGQENLITSIKAGDFIVVEGDLVEAAHQFHKCKLIKNWH